VLIFTSIVVEALPFILLGALVSALIATYVPGRAFEWVGNLPARLQVPGAAVAGVLMPVCECGSVPVAKRLITRGVHPAAGIAFMLSAPVINPIVLSSTFIAYKGLGLGPEMVAGRAAIGVFVAVLTGSALWLTLRRRPLAQLAADEESGHHHHHLDHDHNHSGAAYAAEAREHAHDPGHSTRRARWESFVGHVVTDFTMMGRFIVIGAAAAAVLQTAIPQRALAGLGGQLIIGSLAMMALAFMMSLCSEADAFVAVSFSQFTIGAQMAFLTFGPVMDMKLLPLYAATFGRGVTSLIIATALPATLGAGILFYFAVT
jgi:uncharacterized membrane protein YraQ (UPF0718 family)